MKRKKNKDRQGTATGKPKISQSLWEFAGDFIHMGETSEQRHSLLNAACSAWNIACNVPELRKKHVDHYVKEYRKFNPSADEAEIAGVRSNIEKLIEVKLKMFPHDLRQIVGARIISVGGKDRIEAAALRTE